MRKIELGSALALAVTLTSAASAADAIVTKAKARVDGLEREIKGVEKGELDEANGILKALTEAHQSMMASKDKADPAWGDLSTRILDLKARVRAQAMGEKYVPVTADEHALAGKKALDEVEAAIARQRKGDMKEANRLIEAINEARRTLSRSFTRNADWRASVQRANTLDLAVRAKHDGKEAGAGTAPAEPGVSPKEPGPAASGATLDPDAPLPKADKIGIPHDYNLESRFLKRYRKYARELVSLDPLTLAQGRYEATYRAEIKKWVACVEGIPKRDHPHVRWSLERIREFQSLLDDKLIAGAREMDERKRAAAEVAADVDARLKAIEAFFSSEDFQTALEAPFTDERVREWIGRIQRWEALCPKGLSMLDEIAAKYPQYARDPRVISLRRFFTKGLPDKLADGVNRTARRYSPYSGASMLGAMPDKVELASRMLAEGFPIEKRLANDAQVESDLEAIALGIEAAEGMALFAELYEKASPAKWTKAIADLRALSDRIETGAKARLEGARMPKAATSDKALVALAKKTLSDAKYGVGEYSRLVINSARKRESRRRSEASDAGPGWIRITEWTEDAETFQVTLAEKVDGKRRLVYYELKFFHTCAPWQPKGRWFCSSRIVGSRILEENVGK